MTRTFWTPEQIAILRAMFDTHTAADIARAIGRSTRSVHLKSSALGLRKPASFLAEISRKAMQNPDHPGRCRLFQSGQNSWNTGTKGRMKRNAGTWQAGNVPHNWRPIGHTRSTDEGYLQRKIADTRCTRRDYIGLHHLVWRWHGRSIPPGHALRFIDGNKLNVDINNLELISRADLLRRNSTHRHGTEIAQLSQLIGAIRRQIKRKDTHHA